LRGAGERLGFRARRRDLRREHEAIKPPDRVAFNHDLAALADIGFQRRILAQPTH